MNPFRNTKKVQPTQPMAKPQVTRGTSTGYMNIKKPNIKKPSAHSILERGTLGDNQNFNK